MRNISRQRRDELTDALRRGTVPMQSLDLLAVGLDRLGDTLGQELDAIKSGGARFKAVRGEYGTGKTFFSRWLAERSRQMGFATSEVQISETETPLHRLETVYRRLMERLGTPDTPSGALRNILDGWLYTLEEDVLAEGQIAPDDTERLLSRSNELMEQRLAGVSQSAPMFAASPPVIGFDLGEVFARELDTVLTRQRGRKWDMGGAQFRDDFSLQIKGWLASLLDEPAPTNGQPPPPPEEQARLRTKRFSNAIDQLIALFAFCGFAQRLGLEPAVENQPAPSTP
mgnify:CR=1 FL=1